MCLLDASGKFDRTRNVAASREIKRRNRGIT